MFGSGIYLVSLWLYVCSDSSVSRTFRLTSSLRKFLVDAGILSIKMSSPPTNVKWHSVTWPYTMTTNYWSAVTLLPNSTFYRILEVSIKHLRRMWLAVTKAYAYFSSHLVPSPLGHAYVLLIVFPNLASFIRTMHFVYPSVLSRFFFEWFLYRTVMNYMQGTAPFLNSVWIILTKNEYTFISFLIHTYQSYTKIQQNTSVRICQSM